MPDPSNPTTRVMQVINFLAAHPTEAFTLAEIARHVGLSNGSAHRVLTTLAAGQFLSRNDKHRTYSLGISLVAIGQAAIAKHPGVEIARREIARLVAELNVQCSANTVADNDIVVLAKEGQAQSHLGLTRVGERRPLFPPAGLCHIAWGGDAAIHAYVAKADPYLSAAIRDHLLRSFAVIRERGFAMAANGMSTARSREVTVARSDQIRDAAYWSRVFEMVGELSPEEVQLLDLRDVGAAGVSYIAAPVFSPAGTVAFQLTVTGLPTDVGEPEVRRCVERLRAAAAAVTSELHGRRPS